MKLLVDFWRFPRVCATWSLNIFCFDFHISAEQFYDHNKQELGKTGENHKSTSNAMSNDGSCIEKNRTISWRLSCNQIAVYHTLLEAYNIMRHSSSEQIHKKWTNIGEKKYSLRNITNNDFKVPEKPKLKCLEQSRLTCYHFKWGKPKTQVHSKLCQKIGYGKISLHINQFCLLLFFNKSVKIQFQFFDTIGLTKIGD